MEVINTAAPFVRIGRVVAGVWGAFVHALAVNAERRQLANLDDADLKDLGISRSQAVFEASRPIWDLGEAAPVTRPVPLASGYRVAAE
ncbi:MAG: DUF1127 domain-containing protein [Acidisphaera sp.]|nr:DUF1127 domain-containing protein [Acidisphaera sp.]